MPTSTTSLLITLGGPDYVTWRGDLLARLALARLPTLTAYPAQSPDMGFDYLVLTPDTLCFLVKVFAFSSIHSGIGHSDKLDEWLVPVDVELLRQARESRSPFVLFVFDADTDHGRFLRLDTLPDRANGQANQTVRLPQTNTISRDSLTQFVTELQQAGEE